jgi:hypothetical protein
MPKPRQPQPNFAQLLKKSRWTRDDAAVVVTTWRASDLSQAAFCRQHGLDPQRLVRWAAELPERPAFAEVVVVAGPERSNSTITVELGRARVVVDLDVDDDHLARVLRVVGSMC